MGLPEREIRPVGNGPDQGFSTAIENSVSLPAPADYLADLDAMAEHLRGRFVVQVVVDDERDHRRTHVYRSCAAAERAVERARQRRQRAHVTLAQMLPVGVVGLGGPR